MFFIGYAAGCIGGPQLWTESPRYFAGVVTAIVTWCLLFVTILSYRVVCARDNADRDARGNFESSAAGFPTGDEVCLDETGAPTTDLTDKEDREFRYSW